MTYSTPQLCALEKHSCSWGDTVHYTDGPKVFDRAEGAFLIDREGRRFLDVQTASSAVNLGYCEPSITERVATQLRKLPMLATEYLSAERILLASRLADSFRKWSSSDGRIHFNVGGAQAVDDVMKLLGRTRNSHRCFAFEGAYHGRTLAALNITSSFRYRRYQPPLNGRAQFIPFPYCFRCPLKLQRWECQIECLGLFERLFESECQGLWEPTDELSEFVAFVIEPIQGTGGYAPPPLEYFPRLADFLRKHGILLIDDEIQMGFYRTGRMWALEHFGVSPDIVLFGKSLTNGLNPLSGFWAKEELSRPEIWGPGSAHSTYANNPIGMVAALATLDMIERMDLRRHVEDTGVYFLDRLRELQDKHPRIGDVDGLGLALRIELCESDGRTPATALTRRLKDHAVSGELTPFQGVHGLVMGVGGYYKNVFTLAPPLTIGREEVDLFVALFDRLCEECR